MSIDIKGVGDPVENANDRRDLFINQQMRLSAVLDLLSQCQVLMNNCTVNQIAHNHLRAVQTLITEDMKKLQIVEFAALGSENNTEKDGCNL